MKVAGGKKVMILTQAKDVMYLQTVKHKIHTLQDQQVMARL